MITYATCTAEGQILYIRLQPVEYWILSAVSRRGAGRTFVAERLVTFATSVSPGLALLSDVPC